MGYTFESLSDVDFEQLVADLFTAHFGARYQPFTQGPDGGVDLLATREASGADIVQCKHYRASGFRTLLRDLKTKELPKIRKLSPSVYRLATSVGLTLANKTAIMAELAPYISSAEDVYGNDDINQLLRLYPLVEQSHHKLWLTGAPMLERILNNGLAVWEGMERNEIVRQLATFVEVDSLGIALDRLSANGFCILSGAPGVGKTTVARVAVARLLDKGFDPIFARSDIREAFALLNTNQPQVIFYDDFLGRSSFAERLAKNEDQSIARLLSLAKRSANTKVIFTTREYILQDAQAKYDHLVDGNIEVGKHIVRIEGLSNNYKAKILYNHLYFSDVPGEYRREIVRNRTYQAIIKHKNFNPRLIEWMCSEAAEGAADAEDYLVTCIDALDRPSRIWDRAFDHHLGEEARLLLCVVASVVSAIDLASLETAWRSSLRVAGVSVSASRVRQIFFASLKQLDGSFLRYSRDHHVSAVEFANPSIEDFVRQRVAADRRLLEILLESACYFAQADCLGRLDNDGKLSVRVATDIAAIACEAAFRTLRSPTCRLVRVSSRSGGERFWCNEPTIGGRLQKIVCWFDDPPKKIMDRVWGEITSVLDDAGWSNKIDEDAIGLFERLLYSARKESDEWKSVSKLKSRLTDVMRDSFDKDAWREWMDLVLSPDQDLFTAQEQMVWRGRLREFAESEAENVDSSSLDDLCATADWMESVSDYATIKLDDLIKPIRDTIGEMEAGADEYADLMRDDYLSSRRESNEEQFDIDRMFRSLE